MKGQTRYTHHSTRVSECIIMPPLAEWWVYWNTFVRPSIRPSLNLVYVTSHLSFVGFYSYLVSWLAHDLRKCILYRFHGWLIFARVIALFMFVWPYVRPHILCTHLVICLLSHFIHIWYLGWPWSEPAHIIPISRIDFCANCPGRIHISWFQHSLHSFIPLHHVKSHYNLILYYTSTYVERVEVSQHDNACSFIINVLPERYASVYRLMAFKKFD